MWVRVLPCMGLFPEVAQHRRKTLHVSTPLAPHCPPTRVSCVPAHPPRGISSPLCRSIFLCLLAPNIAHGTVGWCAVYWDTGTGSLCLVFSHVLFTCMMMHGPVLASPGRVCLPVWNSLRPLGFGAGSGILSLKATGSYRVIGYLEPATDKF